jgi:uncharacterized protein
VEAADNLETEKIGPGELAFDIDGVIADTFRAFIKTAGESYGIEIDYESVTEYRFWEILDIDEDICQEIIQMILDNPLGMGIRPVSGASEVLNMLQRQGPLLFVTAREEKVPILEWMSRELRLRTMEGVHVEATGAHENKLPVLLKNGIRYFVDDRLDTCYLLEDSSVTPIVFDQPWNRKPHPFMTVRSWGELSAMIDFDP